MKGFGLVGIEPVQVLCTKYHKFQLLFRELGFHSIRTMKCCSFTLKALLFFEISLVSSTVAALGE